jgi:hypothetical protein
MGQLVRLMLRDGTPVEAPRSLRGRTSSALFRALHDGQNPRQRGFVPRGPITASVEHRLSAAASNEIPPSSASTSSRRPASPTSRYRADPSWPSFERRSRQTAHTQRGPDDLSRSRPVWHSVGDPSHSGALTESSMKHSCEPSKVSVLPEKNSGAPSDTLPRTPRSLQWLLHQRVGTPQGPGTPHGPGSRLITCGVDRGPGFGAPPAWLRFLSGLRHLDRLVVG